MSHPRFRGAFSGLARVSLLGIALALLVLGLGLHTAKAALGERLLGFGSELSRWDDVRLSTAPRRISVNGAELELVVATTHLPVARALDRLETVCEQHGGILGSDVLPKLLRSESTVARSWLHGRVRRESEREGVLACLDTGKPLGLDELSRRLRSFAKSADLSALGALRYATARRSGNVTTILFIWSQGAVPLRDMFPKSGDAPGIDPQGVPRPNGSTRLLSGAEHGAPYSITLYKTATQTPEALLSWYRTALSAAGFTVEDGAGGVLITRQGSRTLLIHAAKTRRGVAAAVAELK